MKKTVFLLVIFISVSAFAFRPCPYDYPAKTTVKAEPKKQAKAQATSMADLILLPMLNG